MCSLPLNQFCSKLLQNTHIKKKLQKYFLQQLVSAAGNRKKFLLVNRWEILIALNKNNAFLGTNRTNPFHYQKFGLDQVTLRRNGLPIASTPISTQDHKRLFFNTLSALGLLHYGLGITLDNYQQHFIMCFDLTSTQQVAHDFLHRELTNCSVSLDLQFSNALTANLEIFVWGIRSSNVFFTSDRKVTKNVFPISTV